MDTPFVSGRKTATKTVMTVIQPAKKRKMPNLKAQSSARNACAMAKVKSRFTATVMLCPADRVSSGKISLGTVHPSGPHDHPNASTKRQITTTTATEKLFDSCLSAQGHSHDHLHPCVRSIRPEMRWFVHSVNQCKLIRLLTWQTTIWMPPLMRSFRRPRRSTVPMEMSVEPKSTAPVSTEE
jgi:hypothetical protein